MITSDHITFDGDTAWLVTDEFITLSDGLRVNTNILDRPCDTCHGMKTRKLGGHLASIHCPDCIDGRHVFDIEVEDTEAAPIYLGHPMTRTYRVSVVEVLPITEGVTNEDHVGMYDDGAWHVIWNDQHANEVTLPSAAAPGMWAVKLAEVQR